MGYCGRPSWQHFVLPRRTDSPPADLRLGRSPFPGAQLIDLVMAGVSPSTLKRCLTVSREQVCDYLSGLRPRPSDAGSALPRLQPVR